MIFQQSGQIKKLKEVYQRLPLLLSVKQITEISQKCNKFVQHIRSIIFKDKEKLKLTKIPSGSQVVYKFPKPQQIVWTYNASYLMMACLLTGIIYFDMSRQKYSIPDFTNNENFKGNPFVRSKLFLYLMYTLPICYNLFLIGCCRRIVLKVWYNHNNNTYYMTLPELFFNNSEKIILKPGDMTVKYKSMMEVELHKIHVMNRQLYYMNPQHFITPLEYSKFIGHF